MKPFRFLALIGLLLVLSGCQQSSSTLVSVEDDNKAMNAAMAKAQETFDLFVENWETMSSDAVSVKVGLPTTDDSLEHIWFVPTSIEGDKITGTCANDAVNIADLKLGDERTFERDKVSDWMILVGNKCYGGYTVRVMSELDPDNAPPLEFVELE